MRCISISVGVRWSMYAISLHFLRFILKGSASLIPWTCTTNLIIEIEEGPVRSYIVTDDGIYGSPLSLETIIRRYERLFKRPVLGNKDK